MSLKPLQATISISAALLRDSLRDVEARARKELADALAAAVDEEFIHGRRLTSDERLADEIRRRIATIRREETP